MTPFVLLAFVMVALATAWLTHPLWRPLLAAQRAGSSVQVPRATLVLGATLALFIIIVVAGGYAWLGASRHLAVGPETDSAAESAERAVQPPVIASNPDALAQAEARISTTPPTSSPSACAARSARPSPTTRPS